MTHQTEPPSPSENSPLYKVAADEYPIISPSEDDEDDKTDTSSGDGGGGKGLGQYKVVLDPLIDFADDADLSEEENTIAKLRKLSIAPMSLLVSGGSSFASENDLGRKVFMADVGLINKEITGRDIADPKFFNILDIKQAERRILLGIKTLDEIVTGAVGAAGAAIKFLSSSISDVVKEKKEARKLDRLAKDFEDGKEVYALDSDDDYVSKSSLESVDFPVQDHQGDELIAIERDRLYDDLSIKTQEDLDSGQITFTEAFNILADIILLSKQPVRSVKLSDDIHFGSDAPGADKDLNPMGG